MSRRLCTVTSALGLFLLLAVGGCEDDPVVATRGAPAPKGGGAAAPRTATKSVKAPGAAAVQAEEESENLDAPKRPSVVLDTRSFGKRRDPFQSYVANEVALPEPDKPRADRQVVMAKYAFEDLKLIVVVSPRGGGTPSAVFLASDGKSKTIKQGEYFSSAEVLLAAVNRDHVEIEVVDDELAGSLNLQRGERRAIYLRND